VKVPKRLVRPRALMRGSAWSLASSILGWYREAAGEHAEPPMRLSYGFPVAGPGNDRSRHL
jgi:hypothetical protein